MHIRIKSRTNLFRRISLLLCTMIIVTAIMGKIVSSDTIQYNGDKRYTISHEVKTPNGSVVETRKYIDDLTEEEKEIINERTAIDFPNAKLSLDPTLKFNCHSYVWYSKYSFNEHWMPDPSPYIDDGSYDLVTSRTDFSVIPSFVSNGTRAVWYDKDSDIHYIHSGLVMNGMIVSKWGRAGLYEHEQGDSPYNYAQMIEYYF